MVRGTEDVKLQEAQSYVDRGPKGKSLPNACIIGARKHMVTFVLISIRLTLSFASAIAAH